jgi:hypothetical protein
MSFCFLFTLLIVVKPSAVLLCVAATEKLLYTPISGTSLKGRLLAFTANIKKDLKKIFGANTLAYFSRSSVIITKVLKSRHLENDS